MVPVGVLAGMAVLADPPGPSCPPPYGRDLQPEGNKPPFGLQVYSTLMQCELCTQSLMHLFQFKQSVLKSTVYEYALSKFTV